MISRLRLFAFLVPASLAAWSGLFWAQRALLPDRDVFASLYRMFTYHEHYAVAFIAVVSVSFGTVGAAAGPALARQPGGRRLAAMLGVLAAAVVVASAPGGVLWVLCDIRAGFVPPRAVLADNLVWGATSGLGLGWLIVAASAPFNVFAAAAGVGLLRVGLRLARRVEPAR